MSTVKQGRFTVEERVKAYRAANPERSAPAVMWLGDLYANPALLAPPPARIPRLAFHGRVTLLHAREKVGKSTIMSQAVAALSQGGMFLGDELPPETTLWYGIDEPLGDTVRRFAALGAEPSRIALVDEAPSPADLQAHIEETGAALVVVDALRSLLNLGGIRENHADDVDAYLRPYITVFRELGVAGVILHHASKGGIDYRGSGSLGAAVDVIVSLRPIGAGPAPDEADQEPVPDDGRRQLIGKGRGVHFHERLEFDGMRYALGAAPLPLRVRLMTRLLDGPTSGNAAADELRVRKESITAEFQTMYRDGLVRRTDDRKNWELTEAGRLGALGVLPVPAPVPALEKLSGPGTGREPVPDEQSPAPFFSGTAGNHSGTGREPVREPVRESEGSHRFPSIFPRAQDREPVPIFQPNGDREEGSS